jgi:hypothetical protein
VTVTGPTGGPAHFKPPSQPPVTHFPDPAAVKMHPERALRRSVQIDLKARELKHKLTQMRPEFQSSRTLSVLLDFGAASHPVSAVPAEAAGSVY